MNNPNLRIAATSWLGLDESPLDNFSTTAAEIVSDEALYPLVKDEAAQLLAAANAYHSAYSRYKSFGGSANKDAKDFAKENLNKAHQTLANKLETTADGNIEYLTRPGYRLEQAGGRASRARVPAPLLQKVESKTVRGRVKFILKAQNPREIKGIVGRYSDDNGLTWTNGIHVYDLNFILDDQPSGKSRLYEFMFHATGNRTSYWSERIYVDVY